MDVVQSQVLNEVENVTESNNFNISTPQNSVAPDLEIENVSEIVPNVFSRPAFKSMKRKYQPTAQEKMERLKACGSGFRWSLDFMTELQSVIEKNITEIFRYDNERKKESDLNLPAFFDLNAKTLEIFIILNSDGVKIMKASSKSIWPVWLAIGNLPPLLRSSFENIVLAALWLGNNKPAWNDIFELMF